MKTEVDINAEKKEPALILEALVFSDTRVRLEKLSVYASMRLRGSVIIAVKHYSVTCPRTKALGREAAHVVEAIAVGFSSHLYLDIL